MIRLSYIVLLVCLGVSLASSVTLQKREAPIDSYAAPPTYHHEPTYHEPEPHHYPVYEPEPEPDLTKKILLEMFGGKDKECGVEMLTAPIILITIFVGIITGASIGILPVFQLPAIPLNVVANKRSASVTGNEYYDYLMEKASRLVLETVESEECWQRLICESGKYAEGRETLLSFMDIVMPTKHQSKLKIFKDSALQKADCRKYKCSFLECNKKKER